MKDNSIIFINSFQRSGSTLLGMLLDIHPDVEYLGELRNLHQCYTEGKNCYCGDKLSECMYWRGIFELLPENIANMNTKTTQNIKHRIIKSLLTTDIGYSALLKSKRYFRSVDNEFNAFKHIEEIYKAAFKSLNCKYLVDSSHRSMQLRVLYKNNNNKLKIVHLLRDGRGITNSVIKRRGCSMQQAAKRWVKYHQYRQHIHSKIENDSIYTIKYEDICSKTEATMKGLFDFVGVNHEDQLPESEISNHFVGGSSTIRNRSANANQITLDEKWRQTLTESDLDVFEEMAGSLNRSLGYSD